MSGEPKVLVWLLLVRDGGLLLALRKAGSGPFSGRWTLPGDAMAFDESSSETIARVAREMLDVRAVTDTFLDTLYVQERGNDYAINVFRVEYEGRPRFRESGPFGEVRWVLPDELPGPLPNGLAALIRTALVQPPTAGASQASPQLGI
jgi:ADP-ribose pyrophosphatase YjhB (NUDIX family)